ncbi:MAG: hypothetical protein AAFY30_14950 [Cyanobacteria bacterium J06642_12]
MRTPADVWQGCSGYWQSAFIRENLLPLGYAAWRGYLARGRGLAICDVEVSETASVDWSRDVVPYQVRYIPAVEMPDYLNAQGLKADYVERLMDVVQTYRPEGELLIAIARESPIEVNWLRKLTISPPECYQQVCNRWDEFDLEPRLAERCDDAE